MKRVLLFAVSFLALLCPNWTMAQPPIPVLKPSLLVPRVIVCADSQISNSTVMAIRQTLVKELVFTDLYCVVDAETEPMCRDYCNKKQIYVDDNLALGRKLGTNYVLLVWLKSKQPSKIEILATIQSLQVYDDCKRAEITTLDSSEEIANSCKTLVKQLCPNSARPDFYVKVDEMPTFQGGDLFAFQSWVHERLQHSQAAQERGVSGVVIVSFIVETDGSMSEITVMNSSDQSFSDKLVRLFSLAPKWQPGKHYGEVVRVKYTVPIRIEKK